VAVIVTTLIAKEALKMQAYSFHGYWAENYSEVRLTGGMETRFAAHDSVLKCLI
jgi:hypothetical protein